MLYIEKVRTYAKTLSIQEAVWKSVQECIREGILTNFLTKYRNEAIRMSIFECDVERELKLIRQDEFNAGLSQGFSQGHTEGLSQGINLGQQNFARLVAYLLEDNRLEDLKLISQDASLCEKLFAEYSIK